MRIDILIPSIALAVVAAGCDSRPAGSSSMGTNSTFHQASLPPKFAFIETNLDVMTIEQITQRVGNYTRVGHLRQNRDELAYEFDLPDGSAVLLTPERPFQARNRVHRAQFFLSTNDFQLLP
jgi:hypothetical protein